MIHIKDNFNVEDVLKGKNLLIISHNYNDFVKDSSESISLYFKEVNICVRYNPFAQILSYLPIDHFKQYRKKRHIDLLNIPSNIHILPTSILYGSSDSQYKKIGDKHFKSVEKGIIKKNIKYDLNHSHFIWSSGYVGAKLKEKYNVPFIVTAHGYDIYDLPFRDKEWRDKIEYVLNAADYITTVSESNLQYINQLNIKTPVKVIPNGFNNNLFFPRDSKNCRKTLNLPLDKKIILTVGNLVEIKGQKFLVEAVGEIVKHREDILCIIIGSGELKNKLQKQIKIAGLGNYIMLAGGRPHDEIPIWMNACDIFVLPSLRESFGVVQIEAMACGKPVVATRNGGSEEIIVNESLGYLVKPKNPDELAEKILMALDKEWKHEIIVDYVGQYDWKYISYYIIEIYKKLLD